MSYTDKTLKKLFGRAIGCAFPQCNAPIIDPDTNTVICEICHIKSRSPGGPRWDDQQTEEQRNDYENLIIMCANHHKIIDADIGSYSVERLHQLKEEHEKQASVVLSNHQEQQTFLTLHDERIMLILEHEQKLDAEKKKDNASTDAVSVAKKLAAQHLHGENKNRWKGSHEGLVQATAAVHEILQSIEKQHREEQQTFEALGINVHKEKGFRSVFNKDFISQVRLIGFPENPFDFIPSELHLELRVFLKRPYEFDSKRFYTDPLSNEKFYPDLSADGSVVWSSDKIKSLSSSELVERVFKLMLEHIERGRPEPVNSFVEVNDDEDQSPWEF